MRGNRTFIIVGTILVGLGLLGTTLRADPFPGLYQDAMVRLMEHRLDWTGGLTSLEPRPMNTPAPAVEPDEPTLQQLPSERVEAEAAAMSPSRAPVQEYVVESVLSAEAMERADALRETGMRFDVQGPHRRAPAGVVAQSGANEICYYMLRNPQLDVVEFGDGTGSIEYWSVIYPNIYYDTEYYVSPRHSLVMVDEPPHIDTYIDPFSEMDYDAFGQGFWGFPNLTYLGFEYSRLYADANAADSAWSILFTLTPEGYLDEIVAYAEIQHSPAGWSHRGWELTLGANPIELAEASGRPLALVFDHMSDQQEPYQWIWLDDIQVTLCYDPGDAAVYLPVLQRQIPADPGPRCIPREPDSLDNPGFTTVDATCHSSFSALDQRDYYTLDLRGASNIRLRLFDLPSDTNWDAMIYENAAGYPIACHIGTPGHEDKWKDCGLDPAKSYFVLVNRGPGTSSGAYNLRVDRR